MSASVIPALVSGLVAAEEPQRTLPMPPILFGLIAFGAFLLGLAVLWTFRNTAQKVPTKGDHNDATMHG